jgi:8-oxo-dGTP diphosphatase
MNQVKVGVGVLVRKEGRMLTGRRTETCTTGAGCYSMPGGNLEAGETWAECGEREVWEETTMKIKVVPYKGQPYMWVSEHFFNKGNDHYVVIWLLADWIEGEPLNVEPSKNEGWTWVTLKELREIVPLDGEHREWLPLDVLEQLDLGV